MPKQKTRKLISRRIKVTKKGKILRRRAFGRHLKAGKSRNHLRRLKKSTTFSKSFERKLRKIMGI